MAQRRASGATAAGASRPAAGRRSRRPAGRRRAEDLGPVGVRRRSTSGSTGSPVSAPDRRTELIRTVSDGLRGQGLRVVVDGPDGRLVSIGAGVRTPWWQRPFVRARHVRVHDLRAALRTLPRRGGGAGYGLRPAGDAVHPAVDDAPGGADGASSATDLDHPRPGRRRAARGCTSRPEPTAPAPGSRCSTCSRTSRSATARMPTCASAAWPAAGGDPPQRLRTSTSSSRCPTVCPSACTAHRCCDRPSCGPVRGSRSGPWRWSTSEPSTPTTVARTADARAARSTSSSGSRRPLPPGHRWTDVRGQRR